MAVPIKRSAGTVGGGGDITCPAVVDSSARRRSAWARAAVEDEYSIQPIRRGHTPPMSPVLATSAIPAAAIRPATT